MTLGIVMPCYNEEAAIGPSLDEVLPLMETFRQENVIGEYRLYCVDDGSKDNTWNCIEARAKKDSHVTGIKLSRNVGHQNALIAGLEYAVKECDAIISIDVDLQDDIGVIKDMIGKFNEGCEIVFGVRKERSNDSLMKRASARLFYRLMKTTDPESIPNHADFRLLSRRAAEELLAYSERNIFVRGIIPLLGLKSEKVEYERQPRKHGQSKYPPMKMVNFAIEGITSFSIRPIRMIFVLGITFLFITLSVSIYVLIAILMGRSYPGWASLMLSLWFIGSLVLIALGIIGEYIGKIYIEVKRRPRYFVEKTTEDKR